MVPPIRDTIDGIINDFEIICHYANPIYFRCLCQAPTEVLFSFSSSLIFQSYKLSNPETFSKDYGPSKY